MAYKKRYIFSSLAILFLLLGIILSIPFSYRDPAALSVPIQVGQEEFARGLELGNLYTRQGELDKAQAAYEKAALAAQVEIAQAAQDNLNLLHETRQSFLYRVGRPARQAAGWVVEHLLALLAAALILAGVYLAMYRYRPRESYRLLPFEANTPGEAAKGFERRVLEILYQVAQTFRDAHEAWLSPAAPFDLPLLPPEATGTDAVLEGLEKIEIGGMSLPLDRLAPFLRRWLDQNVTRISGYITVSAMPENAAANQLVLMTRQVKRERVEQIWQMVEPLGEGAEALYPAVGRLAGAFAFRLLQEMERGRLPTRDWQTLYHLTQGLRVLGHRDERFVSRTRLEQAAADFAAAARLEPSCRAAQYALGMTRMRLADFKGAQEVFNKVVGPLPPPAPPDPLDLPFWLAAVYQLGLSYYYLYEYWAYQKAREAFETVRAQLEVSYPPSGDMAALLALTCCGLACLGAEWAVCASDAPNVPPPPIEGWQRWTLNRRQEVRDLLPGVPEEHRQQVEMAMLFAEGMEHLRKGQELIDPAQKKQEYGLAIADWEALRVRQPDYIGGLVYLAVSLIESRNNPESGRQYLEECADWDLPGAIYGWFKLGKYYHEQYKLHHDPDMLARAEQAFARADKHASSLREWGKLLVRYKGDLPGGLEKLREAARLRPNDPETWGEIAYRILDCETTESALRAEALEAAERRLEITRDRPNLEPRSQMYLGWAQWALGQAARGVQALEAALKGQDCPEHRVLLALACLDAGRPERAAEVIAKVTAEKLGESWRHRCLRVRRDLADQGISISGEVAA